VLGLIFTVNQAGDDSNKNELYEIKTNPGNGEGHWIGCNRVHDEIFPHLQSTEHQSIANAFHHTGTTVPLRKNQGKEEGKNELTHEHVPHIEGHFAFGAPKGGRLQVKVFQNDAMNYKIAKNNA
jgi:hypothetical protein